MIEVSEEPVLAIDIGGTKIALAQVAGGCVRERRQIPTPRTGKGTDLIAAVVREIEAFASVRRIAIATTGMVDEGRLTALNPHTLPIENGFPLAATMERATGIRPFVVNDAQAAAWGEYRYGAGRNCRAFAFVTVSTGIGAGLVVDGRLVIGQHGLAGHLGHVVADRSGSSCGCGRHGCLETLASGSALARRGSEMYGHSITTPDLFAKAGDGDAAASALLEDAAAHLAAAFGDLVAVCDVERIALGGGVGLADSFIDRVRNAMVDLPPVFQRELLKATGGADAGLLGAANLANTL